MDGQYRADLTVRLEDIRTKEDLHILLNTMAAEGSTLDSFPWRIADSLIDVLSSPQASFTYAELAMFCRAEAARNILLAQATWLEDQIATILMLWPALGKDPACRCGVTQRLDPGLRLRGHRARRGGVPKIGFFSYASSSSSSFASQYL